MKSWLVRVSRPSKTPPKRKIMHDWEFHAPSHAQAMVTARNYAQGIADKYGVEASFTLKETKRPSKARSNPRTAQMPVYVDADPPYGFTVSVTAPPGRVVVADWYQDKATAQAAARKVRSIIKARKLSPQAISRILADEGVRSNPLHAKRFQFRYPAPPVSHAAWTPEDWDRYEELHGSWVDTEPETLPWSEREHFVKTHRRSPRGEMLYAIAKKNKGGRRQVQQALWTEAIPVPRSIKKTPRSKATGTYVFPETRSYPIGDLYHARLALTYVLSPSNAKDRAAVAQAVQATWPEYDWASWWASRIRKKRIKSWASLLREKAKRNPAQDTRGEFVAYGTREQAKAQAAAHTPPGYEPYAFELVGHPLTSDEWRYKMRKKRSKKSRKGKSLKGKWRATQRRR
jgi:hypothetical protein